MIQPHDITLWVCLLALLAATVTAAPLIDPAGTSTTGQTWDATYDNLVDSLYSNGMSTMTMGDKLWVPWFKRSDQCTVNDLQSGSACNVGTVDATHNCMVTDEFSQVGIIVAMGKDQTRMDQFYNTVQAIGTTNGGLPSWRVYRNGDTIEACKKGVNGNCDTASDADARIIIALFTASANPNFKNAEQQAKYDQLARQMTDMFLKYEVEQTCRPSSLGFGNICYWLASGSDAKRGGISSASFAYSGYYQDAIDAMLMACARTGSQTYCNVAGNFTLNYLQASNFNGNSFSVPPGRAFTWSKDASPKPVCSQSCAPTIWDDADAPRALGLCQANYYAHLMNKTLPGLASYCSLWTPLLTDTSKTPLQYAPDGTYKSQQHGFFAQGLQALALAGTRPDLYGAAVKSAIGHYTPQTGTWDRQACFGVYLPSLAVRALGSGIGRELPVFGSSANFAPLNYTPPIIVPVNATNTTPVALNNTNSTNSTLQPPPLQPRANTSNATIENMSITVPTPPSTLTCGMSKVRDLPVGCFGGEITNDTMKGGCRTVTCANPSAVLQVKSCNKPDGANPALFYEMYKKTQAGTGLGICLGRVCLSTKGYEKGFFPGCAA